MANPANHLPPEYDDYHPSSYDPYFTADISNKMQVPDKIGIERNGPSFGGGDIPDVLTQSSTGMIVPEKIMLAGQDQHIGTRKNMMNLDLNPMTANNFNNYVGLTTPPRVLNLGEVEFPSVEDNQQTRNLPKNLVNHIDDAVYHDAAGPLNDSSHFNHDSDYVPEMDTPTAVLGESLILADEDEMVILRKHVAKLSRRLMRLEHENTKRSQRELLLYPLVCGYILFQVASWFLKTK